MLSGKKNGHYMKVNRSETEKNRVVQTSVPTCIAQVLTSSVQKGLQIVSLTVFVVLTATA